MDNAVVSVRNLWHKYHVQWAIQDINFDITDQGVVGLLGSNGAGKSTTMNIICGVLNQTRGEVLVEGVNLRENPVEAKRHIGFLPQKPPLYADLTVREYLTHCAHLRLMDPARIPEAVGRAMERCAITEYASRLIRNLSGGYQQRVGIAQAIVHNPKFVILDEPTNGLDPNQIVEIRNLIREIATSHSVLLSTHILYQIVEIRNLIREIATSHSVLLSTHILSEVQAICSQIKMIEHGRLVFSGTMEEFDNYIEPTSFIVEFGEMPPLETLRDIAVVRQIEPLDGNRLRIRFQDDCSVTREYIRQSILRDWDLREIYIERSSLDEIFAQLSGKRGQKQ